MAFLSSLLPQDVGFHPCRFPIYGMVGVSRLQHFTTVLDSWLSENVVSLSLSLSPLSLPPTVSQNTTIRSFPTLAQSSPPKKQVYFTVDYTPQTPVRFECRSDLFQCRAVRCEGSEHRLVVQFAELARWAKDSGLQRFYATSASLVAKSYTRVEAVALRWRPLLLGWRPSK